MRLKSSVTDMREQCTSVSKPDTSRVIRLETLTHRIKVPQSIWMRGVLEMDRFEGMALVSFTVLCERAGTVEPGGLKRAWEAIIQNWTKRQELYQGAVHHDIRQLLTNYEFHRQPPSLERLLYLPWDELKRVLHCVEQTSELMLLEVHNVLVESTSISIRRAIHQCGHDSEISPHKMKRDTVTRNIFGTEKGVKDLRNE
ncbi:unnamed protein product [Thelazia callipaeda]|uniref:PDEase domain-containing protein n=1 Tax=Thelazia callipaeda TaxID=103827 RepID=A0A0N5CJ42_THECL|nr:unnamed protein product [Thelazia callipaeda]